jgi:hypothetical protein
MERVYAIGDKIHVTTRPQVVQADLLVKEGDCYDEFLLNESLRVLRNQIYLASAEAEVTRGPDGVEIAIITRDDWSLKVSLGISVDEGFTVEGLGVSEVNFLGSGWTLGFIRSEDRESLEYGLEVVAPRILTTNLDGSIRGGSTRSGYYFDQFVRRPFRSEQDRWASRERVHVRNDVFAYSTSDQVEYSHLVQEFDLLEADVAGAYRVGRPGRFWALGGGITYEQWEFPGGAEGLSRVYDADFDDPGPADPEDVRIVADQSIPLSSLRANVEFGFRTVRFVQRVGLDAVTAVQDVQTGWDVRLTLGRAFGGVGPHPRQDWFSRGLVEYGFATDRWVGGMRTMTEARYEAARKEGSRWRDVQAESDLYVYFQPSSRHTLFGRFSVSAMNRPDRPFQLRFGGRDGVRGYSRDAFPGTQRFLFTVEDRINLDWPDAPWGDVGLVFFADAGTMRAGDVPYGVDTSLKASVGAGLRLAFPGGSPRVTRIEFTYPVTGTEQAVYFRFYADILGLLRGFEDADMDRSRWGGLPRGLEKN